MKQADLDRAVAIKIPRKSQLDPADVEQFYREARAAAQLKHPHIVSILEVGRHEDRVYIVTDFVQGLDLAVLICAGAKYDQIFFQDHWIGKKVVPYK